MSSKVIHPPCLPSVREFFVAVARAFQSMSLASVICGFAADFVSRILVILMSFASVAT